MNQITCTVVNADGSLNIPHSHLSTRVLRLIDKFPECHFLTEEYIKGVKQSHYIKTFYSEIELPIKWYDIIPGLVSYTVTGIACIIYTALNSVAK